MKTGLGVLARRNCRALFLLAVLVGPCAAQTRVIAIGDVHGAYDEFVSILQRVGLVDANRQWTGGATWLVQTGDVLDRGPKSRASMDLLMELERQAEKQNGRVLPLMGNHEVMNIMGDLRYVSAEQYQEFAAEGSEKVREQAYQDYRKFLAARSTRRGQRLAPDDEATRQKWMAEHPLGYFEQRDGLSPQGVYGRWLRKHDAVTQVGEALFLHGGLDPKLRFRNIGEINQKIRSEIADFDSLWQSLAAKKIIWRYMKLEEALREVMDELAFLQSRGQAEDPDALQKMQKMLGFQSWLMVSTDGPLWYRGYTKDQDPNMKTDVDAMLARLKARRLVVGHTVPGPRRITPVLDSRIFMIDCGMLRAYYQGNPGALEIQDGRITAYYTDGGKQVLLEPPGAVPASQPSSNDEDGGL